MTPVPVEASKQGTTADPNHPLHRLTPEQVDEIGKRFRAIHERHGGVDITQVRRQHESWQQDATRHLATGRTGEAIHALALMRRLESGRRRGWGAMKVAATIGGAISMLAQYMQFGMLFGGAAVGVTGASSRS